MGQCMDALADKVHSANKKCHAHSDMHPNWRATATYVGCMVVE